MSANWHNGNAAEDGRERRGWILGHFIDPSEGVRSSKDVEIKWGIHPAGDKRPEWTADDQRTTLVLLVRETSGSTSPKPASPWKNKAITPSWGPGIDHSWEAITDRSSLPSAGPPRQRNQPGSRAACGPRRPDRAPAPQKSGPGRGPECVPRGLLRLTSEFPHGRARRAVPYVVTRRPASRIHPAFDLASCTVAALFMHWKCSACGWETGRIPGGIQAWKLCDSHPRSPDHPHRPSPSFS